MRLDEVSLFTIRLCTVDLFTVRIAEARGRYVITMLRYLCNKLSMVVMDSLFDGSPSFSFSLSLSPLC